MLPSGECPWRTPPALVKLMSPWEGTVWAMTEAEALSLQAICFKAVKGPKEKKNNQSQSGDGRSYSSLIPWLFSAQSTCRWFQKGHTTHSKCSDAGLSSARADAAVAGPSSFLPVVQGSCSEPRSSLASPCVFRTLLCL